MLDKNPLEWHNTPTHGGVGAPVGLTVFKTAGGSLGAAPGGFDSHTPLPYLDLKLLRYLALLVRISDGFASLSRISVRLHLQHLPFMKGIDIGNVALSRLTTALRPSLEM